MATTSNTYTGNGSNRLFSITFPYLNTADIDVYVNGIIQTVITQYTFANATTVEFVTAPSNGATVLLRRSTNDTTLAATFFAGSSVRAADLNDNFDQVLYLAQETNNNVANAVAGQIPDGTITSNKIADDTIVNADVNASAGITAGKLSFTQAGTGATARTVDSKLKDVVSVKDFGAVGDGVADDTAAIQACIMSVGSSGGGTLSFEPGKTYKISTAINCLYSNVSILGNGATLNGSAIAVATAFDQIYALKIEGSIGSQVTCTADVLEGGDTLSVTSTTGLAVEDMLFVYSNEIYPPSTTSNDKSGALHKVRSISSGTSLVLMDGVFFPMTVANGLSIKKVSTVKDVTVEGLNVVMGGSNKAHCGIRIKYADNVQLINCSTKDTEDCGVRFDTSYGCGVNGGSFYNCTSPDAGTSGVAVTTGYGINPGSATRNCKVEKASFRNCRHAIAGGGNFPSIGVIITKNVVTGDRGPLYPLSYSLDCHEDCLYWTFDGNYVSGVSTVTGSGGILVRGQKTLVTNNVVVNAHQYGILIQNFDATGYGLGNSILNNTIINSRLDGIVSLGSTASPQYNVTIKNNYIAVTGGDGITLFGTTDSIISGNTVKGLIGVSKSGIRLVGTAATAGNRCVNAAIANNSVDAPSLYGIRADFANTLSISGNLITATANDGVRLTSCSNVSIAGGVISTPYNFGSAVSLSASTKVAINGLTAYNTTTASSNSSGVYMSGASTDISISGCQFSSFNRGVYSVSPANYITVVGVNARSSVTTSVDVSASANTSVAGNL
jgi:polygalacturonase